MTEKKGFFRRVFSFGQRDEPEPAHVDAATSPATEIADIDATNAGVIEADARIGADDRADPETTLETADAAVFSADESELPLRSPMEAVAADEPAWLDPDAPEPAADFSWLESDGADAAGIEPAAPVPPSSTPIVETDGIEAKGTDPDVLPAGSLARTPAPAAPEPTIDAPLPLALETPPAATDEPDFSFLDPDAPLPDEAEEDADFSWLEPSSPLPPGEAPSTGTTGSAAAIGAAGVAAAGVAARPSTGEGGWRLREAATPAPVAAASRATFLDRLREGLSRSSNQLSGSIASLFTKRRLDDETLQEFEDVLLQADLGVETALRITDRLSEGRFGKEITGDEVKTILADEVEATLRPVALPLELDLEKKPHVMLVVGVNGTGKTTTIGKLAAKLTRGGLKVTLCAGDTFRAAAVEQLKIWGERTGSEVVAKAIGADAAGLAFEAYDRAVENGSDVLIIDTAGRLQNKAELMAELEKIVRVLQRREPDAPHTVLQTLDATTGQNALSQVEIFRNVAGVNGLVMTKLDGTARGGILVAIAAKYRLPVYFVGVGEGIDDLEPFKARDFALAIAGRT